MNHNCCQHFSSLHLAVDTTIFNIIILLKYIFGLENEVLLLLFNNDSLDLSVNSLFHNISTRKNIKYELYIICKMDTDDLIS